MDRVARCVVPVVIGAATGLVLAAALFVVVLAFPETLLDLGDGVYDADGQYVGLR